MVTRYVDLVNGNDSNDGSSFALRKRTIASAGTGLAAGDEIRVMASPAATSTGINATWTNNSDVVTLASSLTKTVDNCETAWTAATNVTATASTTTFRQGTASASLVIATAFTTGLVAYRTLGSTVDFSSYQQLSFLIRPTATVAANVLSLRLCSDTAGVTVVNSVNIPALVSGEWHKVIVDTGAALGSAIQSVSLSAASDPGSVTVFLDNILACKAPSAADSLTHRSLIRKSGSSDAWFSIESIDDTTITLSGNSLSTAGKSSLISGKYWGSTATVGLDKREPIVLTSQQSFSTIVTGNPNTTYITVSGGWDTTSMSTQTDRTYLCHGQPSVSLLSISGGNSRISAFGASDTGSSNAGFYLNSGSNMVLTDCVAANCGYAVWLFNANGCTASLVYSVHSRATFYMSGTVLGDSNNVSANLYAGYSWGTASVFNQPSYLYYNNSTSTPFRPVLECPEARYHSRGVLSLGNETLTIKNTVFADCYTDISMGTDAYAYNTTFASDTFSSGVSMGYAVLYAQQINGDPTKHGQCSGSGWKVLTAIDQRRSASDVVWKFTALNNGLFYGYTHPSLCVAQVVCLAGQTRTVSLWFRKDHINVAMRLRVKGGFVSGIPTDVVANMTVGINTWEQLSVSFTPTYDCVVPVYAEFTGPTACNGWVDDLSLS